VARVQIHQTIGFTDKMIESTRTPFSLATQVPSAASSSTSAR